MVSNLLDQVLSPRTPRLQVDDGYMECSLLSDPSFVTNTGLGRCTKEDLEDFYLQGRDAGFGHGPYDLQWSTYSSERKKEYLLYSRPLSSFVKGVRACRDCLSGPALLS